MHIHSGIAKIRPSGWMKEQLEIQAHGLSGNLDKIWPDVRDSAWIGGDRESWERVPYWLHGLIPLAWFLEDDDLKARVDRYVHAIIQRQKDDGWICPCEEQDRPHYDLWAYFLIGKVFTVYYEFTGDQQVKQSLYASMKCLYNMLQTGQLTLYDWGKYRWFECLIPLQFLYNEYKENWIIELGSVLRQQGIDYKDYIDTWKRPMNQWTMHTHVVNLAMMLKSEALTSRFFAEPYQNNAETLWQVLEKYNGTAVGTITGDECLSGIKNNQGTELCAIVELMYSFEILYQYTNDAIWADRLEKIAFNALPAAFRDDMWSHQYDQQVNQIACVKFPGKSYFRTNEADAHLFGLEPNFGCCTANYHQGWPYFLANTFTESGISVQCNHMIPAVYQTNIVGTPVKITLVTDYPFRHSCKYIIEAKKPVVFPLVIRIPQWVDSYELSSQGSCFVKEATGSLVINNTWEGLQEIDIHLLAKPHLVDRPDSLKIAEYGPLIFSLPIETEYKMYEYEKDGVKRKFPYCDYELRPLSQWRYAYIDSHLAVFNCDGDDTPFSSEHPRIVLQTRMCPIEWEYEDGYDTVAAAFPDGKPRPGDIETKTLYPYGCSKLRITEIPFIRNN